MTESLTILSNALVTSDPICSSLIALTNNHQEHVKKGELIVLPPFLTVGECKVFIAFAHIDGRVRVYRVPGPGNWEQVREMLLTVTHTFP